MRFQFHPEALAEYVEEVAIGLRVQILNT